MKTYAIKEIFGPTIQGEGSHAGLCVLFVRFAGCNVWSGSPETKAASACPFCDTDFVGGTRMTSSDIIEALAKLAPMVSHVVLSGGEPLLQFDAALARSLRNAGYYLHLETNGLVAPDPIAWAALHHATLSPKGPPHMLKVPGANDLKLLYPLGDSRMSPDIFAEWAPRNVNLWLQPIARDPKEVRDSLYFPDPAEVPYSLLVRDSVPLCMEFIRRHPRWRLSIQQHKAIGVP